jgi:asparagine synthase (glutamine-hydrolysing)
MVYPIYKPLENIEKGHCLTNFQKKRGNDLAVLFNGLVKMLDESVEMNLADGILLSGGLDTSILACLASKRVKLKAFTAALQDVPAPDVEYAALIVDLFGIEHFIKRFNKKELRDAIRIVVKTMNSFDPMEIRNSVPVYIGLKEAKDSGMDAVIAGDGCDELFAGYSFLHGLERKQLDLELQKLWRVMDFSSVHLGKVLGIKVKLPYLDAKFKKFAMKIPSRLKVRRERNRIWGKWILRKAFEKMLPEEIIWRAKTPVEFGSGTSTLSNFFDSIISDAEFDEKKKKYFDEDRVVIRDKEQLFYYEIYRSELGVPHPTDPKCKICPGCNSNMPPASKYCRRCGAYPV